MSGCDCRRVKGSARTTHRPNTSVCPADTTIMGSVTRSAVGQLDSCAHCNRT
eukprot:m.49148 g.49148  ORF g.49148 m.49148 type:complete len:52 (-) comp16042_c0_seq1:654-809(-)